MMRFVLIFIFLLSNFLPAACPPAAAEAAPVQAEIEHTPVSLFEAIDNNDIIAVEELLRERNIAKARDEKVRMLVRQGMVFLWTGGAMVIICIKVITYIKKKKLVKNGVTQLIDALERGDRRNVLAYIRDGYPFIMHNGQPVLN